MSEGSPSCGKEPVRIHRNHLRYVGEPRTRYFDCLFTGLGTLAPLLSPVPVLDVPEQVVNRPGQMFAKRSQIPELPPPLRSLLIMV